MVLTFAHRTSHTARKNGMSQDTSSEAEEVDGDEGGVQKGKLADSDDDNEEEAGSTSTTSSNKKKKGGHAGRTGTAFKWGAPGGPLTMALVKNAAAHQCHMKTSKTMDFKFEQVVKSIYASKVFQDLPLLPRLNARQCSSKFAGLMRDWAKTNGFGDDGTHVNVSKLDSETTSEWDRFMLDLTASKNLRIREKEGQKLKEKQKGSAIAGVELMLIKGGKGGLRKGFADAGMAAVAASGGKALSASVADLANFSTPAGKKGAKDGAKKGKTGVSDEDSYDFGSANSSSDSSGSDSDSDADSDADAEWGKPDKYGRMAVLPAQSASYHFWKLFVTKGNPSPDDLEVAYDTVLASEAPADKAKVAKVEEAVAANKEQVKRDTAARELGWERYREARKKMGLGDWDSADDNEEEAAAWKKESGGKHKRKKPVAGSKKKKKKKKRKGTGPNWTPSNPAGDVVSRVMAAIGDGDGDGDDGFSQSDIIKAITASAVATQAAATAASAAASESTIAAISSGNLQMVNALGAIAILLQGMQGRPLGGAGA